MKNLLEYLNELFGIDVNTSATIILTLLIFLLGIIATEIIKAIIRFRERRTLRQLFDLTIKNLSKQTRRQSKAYDKTSEQFSFKAEKNFVVKRGTINQLSKIDLGYKDIYKAFFSSFENITIRKKWKLLKLKAFVKIWEAIYSIEYWHERSFSDVDFFVKQYKEFNDKRNIALDNHRKLFESLAMTFDRAQVPREFGEYLQKMDSIHLDWQAQENRTLPNVVHRRLVLPLRIHNRKYKIIPIASQSTDLLLTASLEYENMSNLLTSRTKQFREYKQVFRNDYRLLEKSMTILKGCG